MIIMCAWLYLQMNCGLFVCFFYHKVCQTEQEQVTKHVGMGRYGTDHD